MADSRIIFNQYGADGVVTSDQCQVPMSGSGRFFNLKPVINLIGSKEKAGLLKGYDDNQRAHQAEINRRIQGNVARFLASNDSEDNPATLLFPDTNTLQAAALKEQINDMFNAIQEAAQWAVKYQKEAAEANAWLKSIGEYAESKIIESPWHEAIPTQLYLLALLKTSTPADFINIIKDKKQVAHVQAYIRELNSVRETCPDQIDLGLAINATDTTISHELTQFADELNKVHAKHNRDAINANIVRIESTRTERAKTFWGKMRNWFFTRSEKRELSNFKKLLASSVIKNVDTHPFSKGSAAAISAHADNAKRIEAKRVFDSFAKFLESTENVDIADVEKLRDAINVLALSAEAKVYLSPFIQSAKARAIEKINANDFDAATANDLAKLFALIGAASVDEYSEFTLARAEIIVAIKAKLDTFLNPEAATSYILALEQACPEKLGDDALNNFIALRKTQYQTWNKIIGLRKKVLEDTIKIDEIEELYLASVTLFAKDATETMKLVPGSVIAPIKNRVIYHIGKSNISVENVERVKKYLTLFQSEKLAIPGNERLNSLIRAKEEIIESVIANINSAESLSILDDTIKAIQRVWPDAIESQYVTLVNDSDHDFFIPQGQRLDQLPDSIQCDKEARNLVIAIGDVTLKKDEKLSFRCNPVIQESAIKNAMNEKAKSLMEDRTIHILDRDFAQRIAFLKDKEQNIWDKLWKLVVGNDQTPLTKENQDKYVYKLVEDYVKVLFDQRINGTAEERVWIEKRIVQDVEDIASAFNQNLNRLFNAPEQQRIAQMFDQKWDDVDVGHTLLQWSFINAFRKFGSTSAEEAFKKAGVDIISKIDEHARDNPRFIHQFIGKMNKEQLEALNATFVDAPVVTNEKAFTDIDLIGDKETVGEDGQTVLRQSMLLIAVSELVKQELLRYLNDETLDVELFKQHIEFVCAHLPEVKDQVRALNNSVVAVNLKKDLQVALKDLLDSDNSDLEASVLELIQDLVRLHGKIDNEFERKVICEKYNLNEGDLIKHECSLALISTKLSQVKDNHIRAEEVIAKIDDGLADLVDIYIKKELRKPDALTLADIKYHYKYIESSHQQLVSATSPFDLVKFIQGLNDRVVDRFPSHLNQAVRQIQYAFADRLKNGVAELLGKENLSTTDNAEQKLKELDAGPFGKLLALVFDKEEKDKLIKFTNSVEDEEWTVINRPGDEREVKEAPEKSTNPLSPVPVRRTLSLFSLPPMDGKYNSNDKFDDNAISSISGRLNRGPGGFGN